MVAYIKNRFDFKTSFHAYTMSYELYTETSADDTGNVVLAEEVAQDHKGDWIFLENQLFLIDEITPGDGTTTLKISEPENAFDREVEYAGSEDSIGAFIKAALESEFKNQIDSVYALPYLNVVNNDNTSFVAPVTDSGLYNLAEYIKTARRSGVWCSFSISGDLLNITISKRLPTTHTVVFSDGKAQIQSRSFSRSITEKVTVFPENGTAVDFYLTSEGSVSTTPPAVRQRGKWVKLAADADAELLDLAESEFEKNADSYKIELYSEKYYRLFDRLRLRLDNAVFEADITAVMVDSEETRYLYRCGNLPVTLTDKLKAQGTASGSRSAASASKAQWYEIGDIFQTTRTGNPRDLLGYGTWEQIKDRFLVAAGDTYTAGETGGAQTHQHTLDSGYAKIAFNYDAAHSNHLYQAYKCVPTFTAGQYWNGMSQYQTEDIAETKASALGGETDDASNMPPYLAVYMWLRTN